MTLFGNRVLIEVSKVKQSLGWVLIQYECVLITEPDTEGRQYEDTQGECYVKTEDWSDKPISQRTPKIVGKPLEARKRQGIIPPQVSEGTLPC